MPGTAVPKLALAPISAVQRHRNSTALYETEGHNSKRAKLGQRAQTGQQSAE